jgi:hypothetical protein
MATNYKIAEAAFGEQIIIAELDNGHTLVIPMDESNSDYQAYLNRDKTEQSTPKVADETETK